MFVKMFKFVHYQIKPFLYGGFSKASAFGKATLDLNEKLSFKTVFLKPFPKLTEFWKRLYDYNWSFFETNRVLKKLNGLCVFAGCFNTEKNS